MGIRINKYVRDKGIASRREADQLIAQGNVFINGKRAELGDLVNEGDKVTVKGKQKDYQYFLYYKPRGLPTQAPAGTESVITIFSKEKIYPVGRLDKESEGLMILTNDGRVTSKILSQSDKFEKEYIIKVKEKLRPGIIDIFAKGMETESLGKLLPAKAKILGPNSLRVVLKEGKKHQIRIMLAELGYTVTSLKRTRIGQYNIEGMRPQEKRPFSDSEIKTVLE